MYAAPASRNFAGRMPVGHGPRIASDPLGLKVKANQMENEADPLAQFGLDAIDLRWTLKDVAAKRSLMVGKQHLARLIELGLVEMREDVPHLTIAGQNTIWKD